MPRAIIDHRWELSNVDWEFKRPVASGGRGGVAAQFVMMLRSPTVGSSSFSALYAQTRLQVAVLVPALTKSPSSFAASSLSENDQASYETGDDSDSSGKEAK
jgi:hypothetical protein